jgi:hypothetical protein
MTDYQQGHNRRSGTQQGMVVTNRMMRNESSCLQLIGRRGEDSRVPPMGVREGRTVNTVVLDCTGWSGQETCVIDEDS